MEIQRRTAVIDGLLTSYLEAGHGDPVVLLHGGEFGISAEIGWEATIPALAERYRVLAPDMLGFGQSAKVIDFNDGRGMRIRHIARFCAELGRRLGTFRRQLDGCDQLARRRHVGFSAAAGAQSGGHLRRRRHPAQPAHGGAVRLRRDACRPCAGSSRRSSTIRNIRPTRTTSSVAMNPASPPGRGRRSPRRGSGGRARHRHRRRRANGPTSASRFRHWWSRVPATNCCRPDGRRRSLTSFRRGDRPSSMLRGTARRSSSPPT